MHDVMKRLRIPFRTTLLLLMLLVSAGGADAQNREITKTVKPFLKEHCVRCHGAKREEGGVRVDQFKFDLKDLSSLDELQNVLDEVVVGSMPPADEPSPSDQELETFSQSLSGHIENAKEKYRSGGGRPIRRLTKTEYVNTLYDLLGVRVNTESMPPDGVAGSFDTQAIDLYTTDAHLQTSLEVGRAAATRFIASRNMKPGERKTKRLGSPRIKKGHFQIEAKDIPPAGHQILRLVVRLKYDSSQVSYVGPVNHSIYEVSETIDHIDRSFFEATTETWANNRDVEFEDVQRIQVINPQPYEFFAKYRKKYGDQMPDSAAGDLLKDFTTLVNRGREIDGKFVSQLKGIFRMARSQGKPFWEAIVEPMAVAMCSLESMFHFETRGRATDSRYVSPVEMVNRVSYLLWRSAPDQELIRVAQSKEWYDSKVRAKQLKRMIEDKRFERFLNDFTVQWLELDRQDLVAVDERVYEGFNHSAKSAIKEETVQFLSHIIRNDLPLKNLIDSDFMVVNNLTAEHYGLPRVVGDEFRVIDVPSGSRRGGLLTHAGILMQTSTGDRTSIVERGAFVLRKLLNDPPAPPPPLVDELPTSGKAAATLSAGELVKVHRQAPQCASCHRKIDSIGVGMEELDGVGRFRSVDRRLNPDIDKLNKRQRRDKRNFVVELALENSGAVNGKQFRGIDGLKRALLSQQEGLAESYIGALLTMANGRKAGVADEDIIKGIIKQAKRVDYPAGAILIAVLQSDAFKTHSSN